MEHVLTSALLCSVIGHAYRTSVSHWSSESRANARLGCHWLLAPLQLVQLLSMDGSFLGWLRYSIISLLFYCLYLLLLQTGFIYQLCVITEHRKLINRLIDFVKINIISHTEPNKHPDIKYTICILYIYTICIQTCIFYVFKMQNSQ